MVGTTLYVPAATGSMTHVTSELYRTGTFTNQSACDAYFGTGTTTFVAPEEC